MTATIPPSIPASPWNSPVPPSGSGIPWSRPRPTRSTRTGTWWEGDLARGRVLPAAGRLRRRYRRGRHGAPSRLGPAPVHGCTDRRRAAQSPDRSTRLPGLGRHQYPARPRPGAGDLERDQGRAGAGAIYGFRPDHRGGRPAGGVRERGRDRSLDRRSFGGPCDGCHRRTDLRQDHRRPVRALRDEDRFWFENQGFNARTLEGIRDTSLADIIERTTETAYIQEDVFAFHERHEVGTPAEHPKSPQLLVGGEGDGAIVGGPAGDALVAGGDLQEMTGRGGATASSSSSRIRTRRSPTSSRPATRWHSRAPGTGGMATSSHRWRRGMP